MRVDLAQLVFKNWPIKLAALFLAVMLYVAVQAQQISTQLFSLKLEVDVPPGRTLLQKPPTVWVRISGKGSELLRLRTFPSVIHKAIPDTVSDPTWTLRLQNSDIQVPEGLDVTVLDVTPHDITLALDTVSRKDVRVVPLVTVVGESGAVVQGGLSITPSIARILGPDKNVALIDSVTTMPTEITGVRGAFSQVVPLDTEPLGIVRIAPKQVTVSGEVTQLAERSFAGIPVETGAGAITAYVVTPARVSVTVRGLEARVQALTRDSLRVVAILSGSSETSGYARLTVVAPVGIVARAIPDSVVIRRRG
ncbi:MAG: hypothetical protein HYS40_04600 [Gemmatimonadetes bacterium]|nr:hypothetical protein [Gemmatimonadota bacterium]